MELLPSLSNWNEGGELPAATPQKPSADTEELVDAIQHRGAMYTQVASREEKCAHIGRPGDQQQW